MLYPESKEAPLAKRQIADINMYNLKNYEKAALAYQQLTDEEILDDPDKIQLNIAIAYLKSGDFEQGRIELHYLMDNFPSSSLIAKAYYEIASSYLLEGDKALAIDNYRKIVKFYPTSKYFVDSKYGTAVALEEQGNISEAMAIYKDLEGEYTNPPAIKIRIASLEKRLKRVKQRR
jgi:TolA-binding protein